MIHLILILKSKASMCPFSFAFCWGLYFVLVYLISAVLRSLWIQRKKLFIRCASTTRQVTAGLKRSVVVDRSVSKKENSKGCPSWHLSHLSRSASFTVHVTARCACSWPVMLARLCPPLSPWIQHGILPISSQFPVWLFAAHALAKVPIHTSNGDFLF